MKLDKAKITLLFQKEIREFPTKTIDFYALFKSTIKEFCIS